jgi:hypothetical protein
MYKYGMRARGFAPWCQPMKAIIMAEKDESGKYHNILFYSEPLTQRQLEEFELDYLGECEFTCADCACYRCEHLHHCYGQCAKRGCAK